jgi:hypothetical protein
VRAIDALDTAIDDLDSGALDAVVCARFYFGRMESNYTGKRMDTRRVGDMGDQRAVDGAL